jgi:hypothetical protein
MPFSTNFGSKGMQCGSVSQEHRDLHVEQVQLVRNNARRRWTHIPWIGGGRFAMESTVVEKLVDVGHIELSLIDDDNPQRARPALEI